MGAEKCNAVVLRYADYKEADRMLTLFSREEGKLSAAIKGVKKQSSKLRNGAELFALGEYVFNDKAGRLTVIGYTSMDSFYPIREDLVRLWCATLATNMVETVATTQPEPELFDCLVYALSLFAYNDGAHPLAILNGFMLAFCGINGIYPDTGACSHDGRIYYRYYRNGFVCRECAGERYIKLDGQTLQIISATDATPSDKLAMLCLLSEHQLKALYNVLSEHISYCLDKTFKAASFLQSII